MNTSFVLFGIIAVWLLTFVVGVLVAAQVKAFAAAVTVQVSAGAVIVAEQFNAFVEVFFCLVVPQVNAAAASVVAKVKAFAAAVIDAIQIEAYGIRQTVSDFTAAVIDLLTDELPSTQTYHLTLDSDSAEYTAGEYLIRDSGMWRNVYLTAHARALIGTSADVIALSSASVHDSNGSVRVWHVAIA